MEILLANPRGFCAGVDRAIEIVERAIQLFGEPIYVRHEVVHNRYVVDDLKQKGAIFVDELDQVPDDSYVIFSAHGVSREVQREAERRQLKVFVAKYCAVCPTSPNLLVEAPMDAILLSPMANSFRLGPPSSISPEESLGSGTLGTLLRICLPCHQMIGATGTIIISPTKYFNLLNILDCRVKEHKSQ